MTLFAIRCYGKGGFTVMTRAAGLAFLHLWHAETYAMLSPDEN